MKHLTKSDMKRLGDYSATLQETRGKIEDEINTLKEEAFVKLNKLIASYNESLSEARGFIEDLGSAMESYSDERSEKWHDSDAGSNYASWIENITSIDLEDIEEFEADFSDLDNAFDHAENLDGIPETPE